MNDEKQGKALLNLQKIAEHGKTLQNMAKKHLETW